MSNKHYVRTAIRSSDGVRVWAKLYNVWHAMRSRCRCPTNKDYPRYGARGIDVDPAWDSYDDFRAWALAHGFCKGLTLDREDSDGNYGPNNCRWIPKGDQQANIRRAIRLTHNGVTRSLFEWARVLGVTAEQLRSRVYAGWTHEQVLTIPIGGSRPLAFQKRRGKKPRVQQFSTESTGQ